MERFVSVDLPIGSPEGTLELCKAVIKKHTDLGVDSPLTDTLDMTVFSDRYDNARDLQDQGEEQRELKESLHGQMTDSCGISQGQTKAVKHTILWYVNETRDVLLPKNRGQEQNLEAWSFHVVVSQTGARRNVRVEIPVDNPKDLIELAEAILEKHTALGVGSPLTDNINIADFQAKVTAVRLLLDGWKDADEAMQALHGQAIDLIGFSDGQTSNTPETLYFDIITIRNRLLQVHQHVEQNLEQFGFKVVIHAHSVGRKKGQVTPIISEIDVVMGQTGSFDLGEKPIKPERVGIFTATGAPGFLYASETEDGLPGVAGTITLIAGTPVGRTRAQLESQIGLSEAKPFLKVENTGAGLGHYKAEFD